MALAPSEVLTILVNFGELTKAISENLPLVADGTYKMRTTIRAESLRPPTHSTESATEIDLGTDVVTIPVKLCNLPPFNAVASQVLALSTDDARLDLNQLSQVISGDPAFAADILFLANSSLFGFPSRMHSLRHAIALLGLERIKALAVTVAMRGFLSTRTSLAHDCWQHSVACALVCEELAPIFDVASDCAYTAGILHDIGRLGLLKTYPNEMTSVLSREFTDVQAVLLAERGALNVDHGRAGAWLMKSWVFPAEFSNVCDYHHDAPDPSDSEILQVVKAGCKVADVIGFPAVKCQQQPPYAEVTLRRAGRKALPPLEELRDNVTAKLAAFQADPTQ